MMLHRLGRLAEAESEYRAVLDTQTRTAGAQDPGTLVTRQQLAIVLADQNRMAEAEAEQRAVTSAHRQLLSDNDPAASAAGETVTGPQLREAQSTDKAVRPWWQSV
jgi:hypothetical protein